MKLIFQWNLKIYIAIKELFIHNNINIYEFNHYFQFSLVKVETHSSFEFNF